ncbi:MAG: RDD family protein [Dehalococcoidia bacterium]|jgi:uncharacterized RDD family membrane protein YckC
MGAALQSRGFRCAGLEARLVAFLFDSVILLAFTAVFATIALLQLLARSDFGNNDPPNSSFYLAVALIVAVVPFWLVFNVALELWRGQTVGKYIVGIKIARSDGDDIGWGRAVWRLLVLNPLLFHPLLIVPWALLAVYALSVTVNVVVLIAIVALVLLSLVASPVALISILADRQRRALHDRIAGTLVVQGA